MNRRDLLKAAGLFPALGAGLAAPFMSGSTHAQPASDYRALVCVFMFGGNDGFNTLMPRDATFSDYFNARPEIAFSKNELLPLSGSSAGHTWGVNPYFPALQSLYDEGRLAFLLNTGVLFQPLTAAQVLAQAVDIPPFLFSHSDQTAMTQGWGGDLDRSGWAGRMMEHLPASLRNPMPASTLDGDNQTLVLGQDSRVTQMQAQSPTHWGAADLQYPENYWTRRLDRLLQYQHRNAYEGEYTSTVAGIVEDSRYIIEAFRYAQAPSQDFGHNQIGRDLRGLASILPAFRSLGYKRQVFLASCRNFDTHAEQRGLHTDHQDYNFTWLSDALLGFDGAVRAAGMDENVVTLVFSDMGRTLKTAGGTGSDHAWGNTWWVMGGPVAGGKMYGTSPSFQLGGPDDMDSEARGRLLPTTSVDQMGATLARWMGLPESADAIVFPNLANFQQKTLGFLKA